MRQELRQATTPKQREQLVIQRERLTAKGQILQMRFQEKRRRHSKLLKCCIHAEFLTRAGADPHLLPRSLLGQWISHPVGASRR